MHPSWDRLIRFVAAEDGEVHYGQPEGEGVDDVGLAAHRGEAVNAMEFEAVSAWDPSAKSTGRSLTVQKLLAPVDPALASTIRCIGVNYADHIAEVKLEAPPVPSLFLKAPDAIADPNSVLDIHPICRNEEVDWEVELGAVIGKTCRDVSEEDALEYVLGLVTANDITARKHQKSTSQWCYGKGFDGFCPLGPAIVALHKISDVQNLRLKCVVNGKVKQDSTTRNMIFPLAKIISYLSQGTTLRPGTVIITGTPMGIGISLNPPEWLKDGDDVTVSVEGIGSVINRIHYL